MSYSAAYWINKLELTPHIEGGAYRRMYESERTHGERHISTAIYFLLEKHQFSALHRIASDELWHFYYGDPLEVYEIRPSGELKMHRLGANPEAGEVFQSAVMAGSWFGAKTAPDGNYSLVGCTVSPGFDFRDFELADRDTLLEQFPQHSEIISMLTRPASRQQV